VLRRPTALKDFVCRSFPGFVLGLLCCKQRASWVRFVNLRANLSLPFVPRCSHSVAQCLSKGVQEAVVKAPSCGLPKS